MWLLAEAFKRNPDVQSYILSWGVPAWVGNGSYFSAENIEYQTQYAGCVKEVCFSACRPCEKLGPNPLTLAHTPPHPRPDHWQVPRVHWHLERTCLGLH